MLKHLKICDIGMVGRPMCALIKLWWDLHVDSFHSFSWKPRLFFSFIIVQSNHWKYHSTFLLGQHSANSVGMFSFVSSSSTLVTTENQFWVSLPRAKSHFIFSRQDRFWDTSNMSMPVLYSTLQHLYTYIQHFNTSNVLYSNMKVPSPHKTFCNILKWKWIQQ